MNLLIIFIIGFVLLIPHTIFAQSNNETQINIPGVDEIIEQDFQVQAIEKMTVEELDKMLNAIGINIAKSIYNTSISSNVVTLGGVIIGALAGFLGSLGVLVIKEKKTQKN